MSISSFEVSGLPSLLSAIIESTDDAIISKNLDGIISSWNPAAQRMFGYAPSEIIGQHISILIPKERLDEEILIMSRIRAGERVEHFETVRRTREGKMLHISVSISPIRSSSGEIIGASKVARDITEKKQAEAKLHELSRRRDEFLANMSHELRTPMNAIVGLTDLLRMSRPLTERQAKFLDVLKTSADNMLAMVNEVLDFSKLDQSDIALEHIEFDLMEIVKKVLTPLQLKAHEKELACNLNYLGDLRRYYMGDPMRLQQVIANLVGNSIKFTEKGSIDVNISNSLMQSNGEVVLQIEVVDTGIGIPVSNLNSIFDKFYQVDSSITRKYGGSGLGLSIVKALVERMGGTVGVESKLGIGSSFTVRLPLQLSKNTALIDENESELPGSRKAEKMILIVEDYAPNAFVMTALLDHLGYTYEVAEDGRSALKLFQRQDYNLILMDLQMPGIDGFETTKRIRTMEEERGIVPTPIIAVTAHILDKDKDKCLSAGMNDFISKPFDSDVLSAKLAKYLPEAGQH